VLGSGIALWQVCCTTSCRIVVSLSVGGVVYNMSVAGVRVVEFGTDVMWQNFEKVGLETAEKVD